MKININPYNYGSSQITKLSDLDNDIGFIVGIHKSKTTQLLFEKWNIIRKKEYQNLPNLKKIWIPKELTLIEADNADQAPFLGCSSDCVIYTDVESESELPSTWSSFFNNYSETQKLTVKYGSNINSYKSK
ncbi:TPA: hypothetical protein IAA87_05940 [Candidatus Avigastranaerophilus faecigallinarum]|nr:hypothetical protein [Candidatus Avigastranaerophilus faecigallinarum]